MMMSVEQKARYEVVLQHLKARANNMNGQGLFSESSPQKKSLLDLIQSVEKSVGIQPYSHLAEALDSTNDLLNRRITPERYRQVTDCMLSETHRRGKLSIAFGYLAGSSAAVGMLSFVYYVTVAASFNVLALSFLMIPLYDALAVLVTEYRVPKGVRSNVLVDGMRTFLASSTSSEPVALSEAANDASTETADPVELSMA